MALTPRADADGVRVWTRSESGASETSRRLRRRALDVGSDGEPLRGHERVVGAEGEELLAPFPDAGVVAAAQDEGVVGPALLGAAFARHPKNRLQRDRTRPVRAAMAENAPSQSRNGRERTQSE